MDFNIEKTVHWIFLLSCFFFSFFSKRFEQFIFLKIAGLACECMINTNKRPLFTRTNPQNGKEENS